MIRRNTLSLISNPLEPVSPVEPIQLITRPLVPDIAALLHSAIVEAGRNSDRNALLMSQTLQGITPQPLVTQVMEVPTSWEFQIIRDPHGNMTKIKATSKR